MIYLILYLLFCVYTAYFTVKTAAADSEMNKEFYEFKNVVFMYILISLISGPAAFLATLIYFERKYWRFL